MVAVLVYVKDESRAVGLSDGCGTGGLGNPRVVARARFVTKCMPAVPNRCTTGDVGSNWFVSRLFGPFIGCGHCCLGPGVSCTTSPEHEIQVAHILAVSKGSRIRVLERPQYMARTLVRRKSCGTGGVVT